MADRFDVGSARNVVLGDGSVQSEGPPCSAANENPAMRKGAQRATVGTRRCGAAAHTDRQQRVRPCGSARAHFHARSQRGFQRLRLVQKL